MNYTRSINTPASSDGKRILIVVDKPAEWPLQFDGVTVVAAKDYISQREFREMPRARVFNLCKSYKYQSTGYYVSLLGEARNHGPIPSVVTIQDMKSQSVIRLVSGDMQRLIDRELSPIKSSSFILRIYFGQNPCRSHDRLASQLFEYFQAPFLQANFSWHETAGFQGKGGWHLLSVAPFAADAIPEEHLQFAKYSAASYFSRRKPTARKKSENRYDLAILYGGDATPPSNPKAIDKFIKAAARLGMHAEVIQKDDFKHLAEFDGLWIRETTAVNHYTYRFAQRAEAEGLVVIDDPESIVRCTNKVYLTELMEHHRISIPKTIIVNRSNYQSVARELGFPFIVKQPDSSFSQGVLKVVDEKMFRTVAETLFDKSDLWIAQEYIPTEYDWRIGIIDRKPIFACKYFMAHNHWQITKKTRGGKFLAGRVDCLPLEMVPDVIVDTAVRAANAIGRSLYGVDLKHTDGDAIVIEVNDNPNIDAGYEDGVLKDALFDTIAEVFSDRIELKKQQRKQKKNDRTTAPTAEITAGMMVERNAV